MVAVQGAGAVWVPQGRQDDKQIRSRDGDPKLVVICDTVARHGRWSVGARRLRMAHGGRGRAYNAPVEL